MYHHQQQLWHHISGKKVFCVFSSVLCLQNSLGFIVWHPTFQGVLPTLLLVQDGNVFARVRHCSHHRKHISIVAKSTRCPTLQDCTAFLSLVSYPLYWEFSNTSVPVWVQPPPKDVRVQLTGDSKLAILTDLRVCLSASSCSLTGDLTSVYPTCHPVSAGIGPSSLWISS